MHTITTYHVKENTTHTTQGDITHYIEGLEDQGYRVVRMRTRCWVYLGKKTCFLITYR